MISNVIEPSIPLVKFAHDLIHSKIGAGDSVIDATVGNGHDSVFLLESVAPGGLVYGFDIQQAALDSVLVKLQNHPARDRLILIKASHCVMGDYIPPGAHGNIKAVMFNLGYLPGGDKHIITQSESTVRAIAEACRLLRCGGIVTILTYPGHDGGKLETGAVRTWCSALDGNRYRVACYENRPDNPAAPKLFAVAKIA